ncbi:MAG TPA: four helix bundle protein [bacterium]|nr:four helix bundle protein [bacterium]
MGSDHEKLLVWQKSMVLITEIYQSSRLFPKEEIYGLTSQMRRSAVSIASNIAEGKGRYSSGEFRQFLIQARGSLLELETQIQIAANLGYLKIKKADDLKGKAVEIGRMLNGLIDAVGRKK